MKSIVSKSLQAHKHALRSCSGHATGGQAKTSSTILASSSTSSSATTSSTTTSLSFSLLSGKTAAMPTHTLTTQYLLDSRQGRHFTSSSSTPLNSSINNSGEYVASESDLSQTKLNQSQPDHQAGSSPQSSQSENPAQGSDEVAKDDFLDSPDRAFASASGNPPFSQPPHQFEPQFQSSSPQRFSAPEPYTCDKCGHENEVWAALCSSCEAPRPGLDAKRGDFLCPNCGFHNFARRGSCLKCEAPRPASAPPQSAGPARDRPIGGGGAVAGFQGSGSPHGRDRDSNRPRRIPSFREGDWHCPACGTHNFRYREECFKCSAMKPFE